MKCECLQCRGAGTILCPDCEGDGDREIPIERAPLDRAHPRYAGLLEIQTDAQRVIRQGAELASLKPHRADSYSRQTAACLAILDHEAQTLKSKPTV